MSLLLFAVASALVSGAVGDELRIKSVDELIDFSNNVNNGTNYSGTTVFLDSDIDFSGKSFEPIGNSDYNYFNGVFNGQGYVISNLEITSSSQHVGLFGYSEKLTIRNVILDSSCSIESTYGSDWAYVGGIIGYCYTENGACNIENSVNMGSISFDGDISSYLYLGGFAGYLHSYNYDSIVKNCANYGDLTHSGTSRYSYIGGVIGCSDGSPSSPERVYIYNSLNYGIITYNGTTSWNLYLGGIAGETYYTNIENCVSGGKILFTTTTAPKNSYIGSIAGNVGEDISINYIYFENNLSYKKYGTGTPSESNTLSYDSTTLELNNAVSVGNYTDSSLIDALNTAADYYTLRGYSNWLLNKGNKAVSFIINGRTNPIKMNFQIILLPSLASEGNISFDGWYEDNKFTVPLTSFEITSETDLFGKPKENTNNYTITFDTRGGSLVELITAPFNSVVTFPNESFREHCTVAWWENMYGDKARLSFTIPSHNITLYAVWKCIHIKTPDDFVDFEKIVNSGMDSFKGTTVFLDSDLDFTGESFEPIGNSTYKFFRGIFDGQGYVISNLMMNASSFRYVGLFGLSLGLSIKNAILDSSCSITSSYSGSNSAYVGGIIALCGTDDDTCTIENNVNMASVSFIGNISSDSLYLGGIAGGLSSYVHDSTIKNCANYGDVTHSGYSMDLYIGEITGQAYSILQNGWTHILNCLNYGIITHNGTTTSDLYIGGIAGYINCASIENCVSGGKISSTESNFIGTIVGSVQSRTSINYIYFTSDLNGYGKYGYIGSTPLSESNILSYDSTSFELNGTVSVGSYTGTSLIEVLNAAVDYYTLRYYSHWLLNKGNNDVTFTINERPTLTLNSQVILLPSLGSEGIMWFDGWYTDNELTTLLTSNEVTESTNIFGRFEKNTNSYTITFDTGIEEVSVAPITTQFNSIVTLPSDLINDDCVIGFWKTEYGDEVDFELTIPSHDITLYAVWKCTRIKTPEDFNDFSSIVNNGVDYSGTTVFLDSDLDFSGEVFNPIGTSSKYFSGTFDGQGHVISNLAMASSSSEYVGLFGYSEGLTIKNVILDSSCSIASTFSDSNYAYAGGIIGRCYANDGACTIESSVSMVSITFSGNVSEKDLYFGGIAGYLYSSYRYDSTVKNCANYGGVTHSGTSKSSYIGGIVGHSYGDSSTRVNIYNSLNHGSITHNGTSNNLFLGGITGRTSYTTIDNCVSGGKISSTKSNHIGSIVGYVDSDDTSINYCYYTSDLSGYDKYGSGAPSTESNVLSYDSTTFELNGTVSIGGYSGSSLIGVFNVYSDNYTLRDYSHWLLNKGNKDVAFTINKRSTFTLNSQIILLPSLASEGELNFDGWYEDIELESSFTNSEVTLDTELYGKYCGPNFTVTFDVNGGDQLTAKEMTIDCDRIYGDFPTPSRTEATFLGWFTKRSGGKKIETGSKLGIYDNHTLYVHWAINQYTITFEVDGGSECENITQDYNTEVDLPKPTKTGYTFDCWCSDPELTREYAETTMHAGDVTLYAKWTINQYNLTFIFGNGAEPLVRVLEFNETITYPAEPVRTGHSFNGWDSNPTFMPANDTILKALWSPNTYIVTFNSDGGDISEPATKSVIFDSPYGELPTLNRTGYTFLGWFNEKNDSITEESIVKTPDNHTLYAHWTEIPTKQVEIVFSTKDMTRKEIENIVKKYTKADFEIAVIESNNEETRVIVKFSDVERAEEFVRNVNAELGRGERNLFKRVEFVQEGSWSFSLACYPMMLLYLF